MADCLGLGCQPPTNSLFHRQAPSPSLPGAWGRGAHSLARPLAAPGGAAAPQRPTPEGRPLTSTRPRGPPPTPGHTRLGLRARPADPRESPAPTPASQRRLARAGRPSPRQPVRRGHGTKANARPAPLRAPRGRGEGGRGHARALARGRRAPARTHARTTHARGPGRSPDRGARAAAEAAGRRPLGPCPAGTFIHL